MNKNNTTGSLKSPGLGTFANAHIPISNATWSATTTYTVASAFVIRFECEISEMDLQDKLFQCNYDGDYDFDWDTTYYVNNKKVLTQDVWNANKYGFSAVKRERIHMDGLIDMHYIDDNNHRTNYRARFIQGMMIIIRKVDNSEDNNGEENNSD